MLLNKKIWLAALAAVLITIIFFRYQTSAQNSVYEKQINRIDTTDWNNSGIPDQFWLTDDQISRIKDVHAKYDDKIRPQIEKLYDLREEAYQYGNTDNAGNNKIKDYRNRINRLEEQIYNKRLEARDEIYNILQKGQRPYYSDYAFNNWWSWDMDSWCSWDMDRCMMGGNRYNNGRTYGDGCCGW